MYNGILNSGDINELERVITKVNKTDSFVSLKEVNININYDEEHFLYPKEEYVFEYIKQVFPNSYEYFKQIIKGAIDK